ncbi:MAG: hypothetical protein WBB23_22745 [Desulforhopalus sp.]
MERENSGCPEMALRNFLFLFVGDLSRGKQIQEAVKPYGLKINIDTEKRSALNRGADFLPDLVILDGFPESKIAISAYYQLQHFNEVLFLALNNSPNAMKFSHVNRLSFLKIINRDPKPKEVMNAIIDLVESNGKLPSHSIRRVKGVSVRLTIG